MSASFASTDAYGALQMGVGEGRGKWGMGGASGGWEWQVEVGRFVQDVKTTLNFYGTA